MKDKQITIRLDVFLKAEQIAPGSLSIIFGLLNKLF